MSLAEALGLLCLAASALSLVALVGWVRRDTADERARRDRARARRRHPSSHRTTSREQARP